jgi:hypothetical protein
MSKRGNNNREMINRNPRARKWRQNHSGRPGANKPDAFKNAGMVIKEWIATAKELGRLIPEPEGQLVIA